MGNKINRFLSLLLAFVMVLGMFPVTHAHAEGEAAPDGFMFYNGELLPILPSSGYSAAFILSYHLLNPLLAAMMPAHTSQYPHIFLPV